MPLIFPDDTQENVLDSKGQAKGLIFPDDIPAMSTEFRPEDIEMSGLERQIATPESLIAGQAVEPKAGLEAPVVSPEILAGLAPRAIKGGAGIIAGEVAGSIAGEAGVEAFEKIMTEEFKEKYPVLSTALTTGSGLVGAYLGGKVEPSEFAKSDEAVEFLGELVNEFGQISPEVRNIAKLAGISEDQLKAIIKDVPEDQWAKVVAQHGGGRTSGILAGGIKWDGSEEGKAKYIAEMTSRVKAVIESVGGKSFDDLKEATNLEYDSMKKMVQELSINPTETYDAKGIIGTLEQMSKDIGVDTVVGRLKKTASDLAEAKQGSYAISDLIDLKEEANFEWRKASPQDKKKIEAFRKSIDNFIEANVDEKTSKLINDSVESYSKMKTTEKALEIIDNSTKARGRGAEFGEQLATDWDKVSKELEKEFGHLIKSGKANEYDSIKSAVKLTKIFQKKFGSGEAELFGITAPKAQIETQAGEASLSPIFATMRVGTSKFMRWISTMMPTESGKRLRMEKAIYKSIIKSDSQKEFMEHLIDNPNTPKSVRQRLIDNLSKFKSSLEEREFQLKLEKTMEENKRKLEVLSGKKKSGRLGFGEGGKPTRPKSVKDSGKTLAEMLTPSKPAVERPTGLGYGIKGGVEGLKDIPETTKQKKIKIWKEGY